MLWIIKHVTHIGFLQGFVFWRVIDLKRRCTISVRRLYFRSLPITFWCNRQFESKTTCLIKCVNAGSKRRPYSKQIRTEFSKIVESLFTFAFEVTRSDFLIVLFTNAFLSSRIYIRRNIEEAFNLYLFLRNLRGRSNSLSNFA